MACPYCGGAMDRIMVAADALIPPFVPSAAAQIAGGGALRPEQQHYAGPARTDVVFLLCGGTRCRATVGG